MPDYLYGDSSRLKQILIILVKIALKGVVNANFCISARYDTDTQLLYVEVDDPMGYINAKMERNPEQKDNSVASRSSVLYPQNEVEPIIL